MYVLLAQTISIPYSNIYTRITIVGSAGCVADNVVGLYITFLIVPQILKDGLSSIRGSSLVIFPRNTDF